MRKRVWRAKDGVESGKSSFEEAVKPTLKQAVQRFEHYQVVTGEHGTPVELGRGAMGVTYKAFDVDCGVWTVATSGAARKLATKKRNSSDKEGLDSGVAMYWHRNARRYWLIRVSTRKIPSSHRSRA
jgi:hypothetical protein